MRRVAVLGLAVVGVCFAAGPAWPQSSSGFGVQVYALASSGWTIRERDPLENRVTDVQLSSGGGTGLRITYDFSRRIGAYAGADLNAEQEGLYGSYRAGVLLRAAGTGPLRFHARAGGMVIDVVAPLGYADLGLGGELFIARGSRWVSISARQCP
ncbi:MAG TPA: hypothetical protein VGJ36_05280 [Gemmatimonadales bacterium]